MAERSYNHIQQGVDQGASSIGPQMNEFYYQKKALIEAKKTQFFSQLADVTNMPKHFGKKIKRYHYLPLLDDANVNDQGIDAAGVVGGAAGTMVATASAVPPNASGEVMANPGPYVTQYFTAESSDDSGAAAITAADAKLDAFLVANGIAGADAATRLSNARTANWVIVEATAVPYGGNLYGSSKDIGSIPAKMPTLSEHGGRVNRVGFKRVEVEGSIEKYGFFDEYTQESLDFDSDAQLEMHVHREMVNGASEITEDLIQLDLINGAGVLRFGGAATARSEVTGDLTAGVTSIASWAGLQKLELDLDNNRCPKDTKLITGSRMVDTRVISAARYMYIGSELLPQLKKMTDGHATLPERVFVDIKHYAEAGMVATGEVGSIGGFRLIVVPEMMYWEGGGALTSADGSDGSTTYRNDGTNYNVYPMLVVGDGSFTTIGFQTDGKSVKFKITHKKPGDAVANRDDPYGEVGFMSIKWYYGSAIWRPERIALYMTVAEI